MKAFTDRMRTGLKKRYERFRKMMLMRKHCDNEVYKVATQDDINHYSYAVSPDGFFDIFIDHI